MMREMTVQEFAQEVKNMAMEVMPEEFDGAMMEMSKARVGYNEEDEELIFYTGDYNHGGNASMTIKTGVIESIYTDEVGYHFTLNNGVTFSVSETPGLNGNLNDLLDKPSHRQCELARVLMKSTADIYMVVAIILCSGEAVIAKFAEHYFKGELLDGTPFNMERSKELTRLGIITIGVSIVTEAVAAIVYEIMSFIFVNTDSLEIGNWGSVGIGITFIIVSLICRYGAERGRE